MAINKIYYHSFETKLDFSIRRVPSNTQFVGKNYSTISIASSRKDVSSVICSITVSLESYTNTHVAMYNCTTHFLIEGDIDIKAPVASNEYEAYAQLIMLAEFNATTSFVEYARGTEMKSARFRLRPLSAIISDVQSGVISVNN